MLNCFSSDSLLSVSRKAASLVVSFIRRHQDLGSLLFQPYLAGLFHENKCCKSSGPVNAGVRAKSGNRGELNEAVVESRQNKVPVLFHLVFTLAGEIREQHNRRYASYEVVQIVIEA